MEAGGRGHAEGRPGGLGSPQPWGDTLLPGPRAVGHFVGAVLPLCVCVGHSLLSPSLKGDPWVGPCWPRAPGGCGPWTGLDADRWPLLLLVGPPLPASRRPQPPQPAALPEPWTSKATFRADHCCLLSSPRGQPAQLGRLTSFCSSFVLKGSSLFVQGWPPLLYALCHSRPASFLSPDPPTPHHVPSAHFFRSLLESNPRSCPWGLGIENLSSSPLLQGQICNWKGVPWGPGGVPPCLPLGPGAPPLLAGNTQTTARPGPRGRARAASRAATTGATTTTTGGWST